MKYIDYTPISLKTFLAYISLFSVNIAFTKAEAGCLSCQTQSNKNNTHLRPSKKQQPEHDMYKQFVVTLLQKPWLTVMNGSRQTGFSQCDWGVLY